jgi:hypothetical protein
MILHGDWETFGKDVILGYSKNSFDVYLEYQVGWPVFPVKIQILSRILHSFLR